uniref:Uncharacterized protein n=1 Tax=Helianthus annuus TaxID=4232 RepID=A0A251RVV7_HELAN
MGTFCNLQYWFLVPATTLLPLYLHITVSIIHTHSKLLTNKNDGTPTPIRDPGMC